MRKEIIPELMQAVSIEEYSGKLIIRQVPVPKPGPGEVLIKMAAAPVNPSDLARIRDTVDPEERKTFVPGLEGSGTVVDHGTGLLPGVWQGRRVACSSSRPGNGTWAEYMVTSAMDCVPLPANVTFEQGAMMLVNPLTATAFMNIIKKNRHKAIVSTAAASSLGRIISMLGEKEGIRIIHIVRNDRQREMLVSKGATWVLDSSAEGFDANLRDLAAQLQVSLVLDAIGGKFTRQLLLAMPYGCTVMVYGNLSGEQPEVDHKALVTFNKKICGFFLGNWLREQGMITLLGSILKARRLIQKDRAVPVQGRFPFSQAQQAVDFYLSHMTNGKVLLVPGTPER
jgi:NADPH:quinone reductase